MRDLIPFFKTLSNSRSFLILSSLLKPNCFILVHLPHLIDYFNLFLDTLGKHILTKIVSNKKVISTAQSPKAIGPYSQAILSDGWLFISGQIPIDPATHQLISDDIKGQTKQVLENLQAIIKQAGGSLGNVVKTTVYLKDMNEFPAMNEVYAEYFPKDPPARATVEVSRLPKDVRIEIDAIARLNG